MKNSFFGISLYAIAALQPVDSFLDGLVKLDNGSRDQGYSSLEVAFENTEQTEKKAQLSIQLAFADQHFLKKPKHFYADFALKNTPDQKVTLRARLNIVMADSFFEFGKVPESKIGYESALKISNLKEQDQEYVTYKLGWVLLNQNELEKTHLLWNQWLKSHSKGDLRPEMLRDFTKAWVEWVHLKPQEASSYDLVLSDKSDYDNSIEGFLNGIRREQIKAPEFILPRISENRLRTKIAESLLVDPGFFFSDSCKGVSWMPYSTSDFQKVQSKALIKILGNCLKQIEPTHDSQHALLTATVEIYSRLERKDLERWPLAQAYAWLNRGTESCKEFISLLTESNLNADGTLEKILSNTIFQCRNNVANIDDSHLLDSIRKKALLLDTNGKGLFATLLASPVFRNLYLESLKKSGPTSQVDWAIALYLQWAEESLTPEAYEKELVTIQNRTDSVSLDNRKQAILLKQIKNQNWTLALDSLRRLAPLNQPLSQQQLQSWTLVLWNHGQLQSSRPPETPLIQERILQSLQQGPNASLAAMFTAFKLRDRAILDLWKHWALLHQTIEQNAELLVRIFEDTLEFSLEAKDSDRVLLLQQVAVAPGDYAKNLMSKMVAINKAPDSMPQPLTVPTIIAKSSLVPDLIYLRRLRSLEYQFQLLDLEKSPNMTKTLGQEIASIQKVIRETKARKWNSKSLSRLSEESLKRAILGFADAIERTKTGDPESKDQLTKISATVRSWVGAS